MGTDLWGTTAIVGVGETDYVRGSDRHVCDLILDAAMEAITDAGLKPADINGIIPPPGYMSAEEIAAHLGVPDVAYHVSVLMGGASPTASLQTAAMAIAGGLADNVLVCMGWNGYSALRPKPDARPTKRVMNLGPMGETVRNHYAPYGLMSAAQHYSLYLRRYVDTFGIPEDAAAAVAIACRNHAQLNSKALMRGTPLSRADYDRFVLPHSQAVFTQLRELHPDAPGIHYGVGCDHLLESMYAAGPRILGLDWRTPISQARARMGADLVVQGNLDPGALHLFDTATGARLPD